jgi:spermidine synthase
MLEALASAYAPEARTALVLGLGAGVVPRTLAARGLAVDVVEINADMLAAVREHVEAAPAWQVHIGDARTFVRACRQRYDLAVVDLFHGDGTPDYLLSADFFRDLRQCLTPTGVTVMNAFALDRRSANYRSLIATVQSVFPHLVVFRRPNQPDEPNMNTYLVAAAAAPTPTSVRIANVPADLQEGIAAALRNREVVARAENGVIVTDAHNVFSILNAADQMILRQLLVQQLPPQMLAN